jgi:hypothetical protein
MPVIRSAYQDSGTPLAPLHGPDEASWPYAVLPSSAHLAIVILTGAHRMAFIP